MLSASDGVKYDGFGYSAGISGDYAIVGAYRDSAYEDESNTGAAYIFQRSGSGWAQADKLIGSSSTQTAYFGTSVAISGDYAIIGSPSDNVQTGAAYVFQRSVYGWNQVAQLIASDAAQDAYFGSSVAISGDYAIIGASDSKFGAVYAFQRSGATWTQVAKLTASDGAADDGFGSSAAISGDYVIVGAMGDDSSVGSAYVFQRSGAAFTQMAKLIASDGATRDFLGCSVAISGDYVIVGASGDDSGVGAAYVFQKPVSGWTNAVETTKLTVPGVTATNYLGSSVAISGQYAMIGAPGNSRKNSSTGVAYIFQRSDSGWTQTAALTADDKAEVDGFGFSVAMSDEYALVGAFIGNDLKGAAYAFSLYE